jgi:hypothetical protein
MQPETTAAASSGSSLSKLNIKLNPDAFFNSCEQLLSVCLEDCGVDDNAVAARLRRAADMVLDPKVMVKEEKIMLPVSNVSNVFVNFPLFWCCRRG